MKAIYINLDPYLAAFAAWLKAGKPGTTPSFDPLPLAVTVPLGQSVAAYMVADAEDMESASEAQSFTIDGQAIYVNTFGYDGGVPETAIALGEVPALSALAPTMKYLVLPVSGDSLSFAIYAYDETGDIAITIPFTVLVRRETASGPVDLVDFTPPAAAPSAADIKSALVAAGDGALAGVCLNGTKYLLDGETELSSITADPGAVSGFNVCIVSNPGS